MKYVKSLYEFVNLNEDENKDHLKSDPESEVTVSDITLDKGKTIKAQEILGVIVSAISLHTMVMPLLLKKKWVQLFPGIRN